MKDRLPSFLWRNQTSKEGLEMKNFLVVLVGVFVFLTGIVQLTNAATVTVDFSNPISGNSYTEDGFTFQLIGTRDPAYFLPVGAVNEALHWSGNGAHPGEYGTTPRNYVQLDFGGSFFDLFSFNAPYADCDVMLITASNNQSFLFPGQMSGTFNLNWTGISWVEFHGVDIAYLDNVVLNTLEASVPEPTTIVLLGSGLLIGIPFFRKKIIK